MTVAWRKSARDFWSQRTRALLVVLAIAVGVAGFGAVLSSYAILLRELDAGHLATNPASATLWTDAVDDELLSALAREPDVAEVEARRTLSARIKTGPIEWRDLRLFVVMDFADVRVSRILPDSGAWPPGPGELLLERDAFQVAHAQVGDAVTVRTAAGREATLRVSGGAHDVGQAQARMEQIVYAYATVATLAALGEEPFLDEVKLVVGEPRLDADHVHRVADRVAAWLREHGHPVRYVDVPEPGKHPHSKIMAILLLALCGFGLFALGLSGILVVNLLTALLAAQVRQIGVMKALGATRGQVAAIYGRQVVLLGAAALLVSLPAGYVGARLLSGSLARLLNFDLASLAVPAWVWSLELTAGLGFPLLAASWPIWKGCAIPVRAALDDFEVGASRFGEGALDRALAGVRGAARPLLLSVRNAFRRRTRFVLTLATLAIGGLFFTAGLDVRAAMIANADRAFGAAKYHLIVSFGSFESLEKLERAARAVPGVVDVEGWITFPARLAQPSGSDSSDASAPTAGPHAAAMSLHGGSSGGSHGLPSRGGAGLTVLAVPPDSRLLGHDLLEGRALAAGDESTMVVNSRLAAMLRPFELGDDIEFAMGPANMKWRVVGVAREPLAGPVAYLPLTPFERAGHAGQANSLRLRLDPADAHSIDLAKARLEESLAREGLRAQSAVSTRERRRSFDEHLAMIQVALVIVSAVILAIGALGLATTMSLNVLERRRELGVMRAIGATPARIAAIVMLEAAAIAAAAFVVAELGAWPVRRLVADWLASGILGGGPRSAIEPLAHGTWLVVSLVGAVLASALPAWRASREPVRDAIASA